jgi:pantothenate kinase
MDGYHYSRAHLSSMPNPEHAHARRGAAFTFDAPAFLSLVKRIRSSSSETIYAPSFDHAKKDPVENEIELLPSSRIVVFEGNYLSLGKGEWREAAVVMDELVCIFCFSLCVLKALVCSVPARLLGRASRMGILTLLVI